MGFKLVLEQALAVFEAFRRLGFTSDEIFFTLDSVHVFMTLRTQGREFVITCGPYGPLTPREATDQWNEMAREWNGPMTETERQRIWGQSFIFNQGGDLIRGLVRKGIQIPKQSTSTKQEMH